MRSALPALLLALVGCTYTGSASKLQETLTSEELVEVLEVLDERPTAEPAMVETLVGDVLVLYLAGPRTTRCRVVVERRTIERWRLATATYIPENARRKQAAAWLGLPLLAPLWMRIYYGCHASDAAERNLDRYEGVGPREREAEEDGGGSFVISVMRRDEVGDPERVEEERSIESRGPLRGVEVTVTAGDQLALTGRTDATGHLGVPLRLLRRADPGLRSVSYSLEAGEKRVGGDLHISSLPPQEPVRLSKELRAAVRSRGLEAVARELATRLGSGSLDPSDPEALALPLLLKRLGRPFELSEDPAESLAEVLERLEEIGQEEGGGSDALADLEAELRDEVLTLAPWSWKAHRLLAAVLEAKGDPEATRHIRVAALLLPATSPLAEQIHARAAGR